MYARPMGVTYISTASKNSLIGVEGWVGVDFNAEKMNYLLLTIIELCTCKRDDKTNSCVENI